MAQEIYHRSEWGNPNEQWGNVYLNADLTNELYKRASEYENSWVTDQLLNGVGIKPSIILTPTAYEDGILNSVKPKGGENLLTYSEDFSQSNWQKYQISLNSNNTISPDGTQNASEITINSSTPSLGDTSLSLTVGDTYTLSCFVKKGTNRWVRLASVSSGSLGAWFDLENNVVGTVNSTFASIENYGNGWYRISNTITAISGTNQAFIGLSDADGGTSSTQVGNTVYVWGFQVERGSKTSTYISTNGTAYKNADFDFTRGSSATRVNEQGLVEDVQILSGNLVQNGDFSQIGNELIPDGNFTNQAAVDYWQIADTGGVKRATKSLENGFMRLTYDIANGSALFKSGIVTSGKSYKVTFIAKGTANSNFNSIGDNINTPSNPQYVVSNPTLTDDWQNYEFYVPVSSTVFRLYLTSAQIGDTLDITNLSVKEVGQNWTFGTGWSIEDGVATSDGVSDNSNLYQENILTIGKKYKVSVDVTRNSGEVRFYITSNPTTTITSSGTYTFYGVCDRTDLDFYIKSVYFNGSIDNISIVEVTDDTDLPRIDYTDGEGSLLLEPQSTNLITYSEDFSGWVKYNSSVNTNLIQSPSGFLDADKIIENTNNSTHFVQPIVNNVPSSGIATLSVFAKKGENNWIKLVQYTNYANFDLENGVIGNSSAISSSIINYGNGWYKCIMNFNVSGGGANLDFKLGENNTSNWDDIYTGDGTSGVYIWGAQLEEGYATSYIPTNESTVTRLADVCNNSGSSDLINSTEGVLYAEIAALADDLTRRIITITDGTLNNIVKLEYKNVSNQIEVVLYNGNTQCLILHTLSDETEFNKIAFKYKQDDFSLFVNGVKVGTDASGVVFNSNTLNNLSFYQGNSNNLYGNVKCVAVFKEALSSLELAKLTQV